MNLEVHLGVKKGGPQMTTSSRYTLQGTNISFAKAVLKIIFLFPRWDMLVCWRVLPECQQFFNHLHCRMLSFNMKTNV